MATNNEGPTDTPPDHGSEAAAAAELALDLIELPVLPLREVVAFPQTTRSFNVGRPRSVRLVEALPSSEPDRRVALVLQRNPDDVDPGLGDLYQVGTLAQVVHVARARREGPGDLVVVATHRRLRLLTETQREQRPDGGAPVSPETSP